MMQARFPIEVSYFVPGGYDDYGEPLPASWGPYTTEYVYGINFPDTAEAVEGGHDRVIVDKVLLVPPGFSLHAQSRIRIGGVDGELYDVIGEVEDASANPLGWNPGGRLKLSRVAG